MPVKGTANTAAVELRRLNTLKDTKPVFFYTPKRYEDVLFQFIKPRPVTYVIRRELYISCIGL